MQEAITITKSDLAAALKTWDAEAKANGWQNRPMTEQVFNENADYLIDKMAQAKALRNSV